MPINKSIMDKWCMNMPLDQSPHRPLKLWVFQQNKSMSNLLHIQLLKVLSIPWCCSSPLHHKSATHIYVVFGKIDYTLLNNIKEEETKILFILVSMVYQTCSQQLSVLNESRTCSLGYWQGLKS